MNTRIQILEYGEENLKLLVDKYKDIATQLKENNNQSPSKCNDHHHQLINKTLNTQNIL